MRACLSRHKKRCLGCKRMVGCWYHMSVGVGAWHEQDIHRAQIECGMVHGYTEHFMKGFASLPPYTSSARLPGHITFSQCTNSSQRTRRRDVCSLCCNAGEIQKFRELPAASQEHLRMTRCYAAAVTRTLFGIPHLGTLVAQNEAEYT